MEKILVTSDFSANSNAGIRFAMQLSSQQGSDLIFYHTIEIMKPTSWNEKQYKKFADEKIAENTARLRAYVTGIHNDSGTVMGNHQFAVEIGTDVKDMIIRYAKKIKAGYICMSTRGAGQIKRLFGTTASSLITSSPVPLIVVPDGYRIKPITTLFYASDFSALTQELRIVQTFAAPLNLNVVIYHYDYLLHVTENRNKLEKKVKDHEAPGVSFHLKRQETEHSLTEQMKQDISSEKASLVVLFTKQNRNWFDRLFAKQETADMAFHSTVPLLVFRKKG